jgi:glycosyltransferase involved in cell wall biosynthesis
MRIFLHDYGGYAFTLQLAKAWAKRGHTVYYAFSATTQYVKRAEEGDKVKGLTYRGINLLKPFQKYSFYRRYQSEVEHGHAVAREIHDFQPDIVISANTPLDAQSLIFRSCKDISAKFVFWFQDAISIATQRVLHKKFFLVGDLIGKHYQTLEKSLLRSCDKVILIAEDFQLLMNKWRVDPHKITVIPNWMPLEEIAPQDKQNPWSLEHDLADKFCFIYTGILGLKHDPELFIHLARQFCPNDNVRVVVVSQGEKAEELKSKANANNLTNLIIMPFQSNEVYSQVLGSADVLVSILNVDAGIYSVPSKVLTYFCAGRSMLLSVPVENAAARVVMQAKAGLVSSPDDVELFLKNARILYTDQAKRLEMGQNARNYAEKEFDIENILSQFRLVL